MQTVGHIDVEKYRCIAENISTDEVIITDERIIHIQKNHPGDYECLSRHISDVLRDPDYILEANKPNTGILLKDIVSSGEKIRVIVRVKVESDPDGYKNSILSFWRIGSATWGKNIKNKKILYAKKNNCPT